VTIETRRKTTRMLLTLDHRRRCYVHRSGSAHLSFAPSKSRSIRFDGFIVLPKRTPLSVLDYMNLEWPRPFVTGTSIGTLFKVKKLDPDEQGLARL